MYFYVKEHNTKSLENTEKISIFKDFSVGGDEEI